MANPNGTPKNLRPSWRPGQAGNPRGRPKGRTISTLLREILGQTRFIGLPTPGNRTLAELVVETMVYRAVRGDFAFTKMILDRADGRVKDAEPISSPVEQALDEIDREDAADGRTGEPPALNCKRRVAC